MATSLTHQVAGEIRAELGRQRKSGVWLAKQIGMSQSRFSRRLVGDYPFDLQELESIAAALDVPLFKLLGWGSEAPGRFTWTTSPEQPSAPTQPRSRGLAHAA